MELEDTLTSPEFIKELSNKIFSKALLQPTYLRNQIEIEIRFGSIITFPRRHFLPSISKTVFFSVLSHYHKLNGYKEVPSLETNYITNKDRFALIDKTLFYNTKKKLFNFDKETPSAFLDFRVSFTIEKKAVSVEKEKDIVKKSSMVRKKKRISFMDPFNDFKVEFTEVIVFERNKDKKENFEIEIEILNNAKFLKLLNENENGEEFDERGREKLVEKLMGEVCKILKIIKQK
eukprot:GAHX01003204.1.p1 GENE.GAHX01003204.1~~GAHX01003204.1.p1  ORF type:complete len:233 (-),score=65.34 GAHX01003204.1:167-865(-)